MRSTMTVAEEEGEAPSNSEMISSLPAMSGCSKAVLGLEMLIWPRLRDGLKLKLP
jgi:hypothetical protein